MAFSAQNCLCSPKQSVTSPALYMALFSKHCSSHYHHHMLLALSSLISASVHSHVERDSERKLKGGHVGECIMKCSRDTEKCVKPTLFQNRSHTSAQFSWGLAIKQTGVWCRETVLLKSLSWKMEAGNDSRENSLSTLNCSSLSLWNHNDFRCTLLWLEPSFIPSSFWSAIDFYCSLLLLFFLSYSQWSICSRIQQLSRFCVVLSQDNALTSLAGHC